MYNLQFAKVIYSTRHRTENFAQCHDRQQTLNNSFMRENEQKQNKKNASDASVTLPHVPPN